MQGKFFEKSFQLKRKVKILMFSRIKTKSEIDYFFC